MPKHSNSTGPSRGRRGSTGAKSSRSFSKGASSSKPFKKDGAKPFRKRADSGEEKSRPFSSRGGASSSSRGGFNKSDRGEAGTGGFRKRSDESFSERKGPKRSDAGAGRPVRARRDDSAGSSYPKKSFGTGARRSDSDKPFRRGKDDGEGFSPTKRPRKDAGEGSSYPKKSFGAGARRSDSDKPFRRGKEEGEGFSPTKRPRKDAGEGSSYPKKSFGAGARRSDSDKPFRRGKDDGEGFSPAKRPRRDDSAGSSYPKKSFGTGARRSDSDKPFRRGKDDGEGFSPTKRPRKDAGEGSSYPKKSFGAGARRSDSDKPFRRGKDEGDSKKPFRRKEGESFSERRASSSGERPTRSLGKSSALRMNDEKKPRPIKKLSSGSRKTADTFDEPAQEQTGKIRLNKFISNSGVCSRREADQLITMGLISVNGTVITELGYKVNPDDEIRNESTVLRAEKPVYVLLNKPKGYLTTTADPQERKTVMQILGGAIKERIYPIGRLDRNTTGLLLLTNDGDLADKLMHPSYNVKKIYKVELDRPLTKGDFQKIAEGVQLEEGRAVVDDLAIVSEDNKTIGIELHIGWNRVVRRIFESLQYEVVKLDRSVYAGLDKKDLGRGEWRFLRKEEVVRLKHYK